MQLATLLSLLISATCLLIGSLLLTISFPPMTFPFSSLPSLVEHHAQVMVVSSQNLCMFMFCLWVCVHMQKQ